MSGVVRRRKTKKCKDINCGSDSTKLIQCNECWATFCTECLTEDFKARHQKGIFCMDTSRRTLA
jgi:hypothetical protein